MVVIPPPDLAPRTGTGSVVLSDGAALTGAVTLNGLPLAGGGGGGGGGGTELVVGSIAGLRTIGVSTFSSGRIATVLGHGAAGDGGGGTFWFNAGDTFADDNGLTIAPSTGTGRWYRLWSGQLNVRWYGAKGDGTTNDTTAIQAAATWFDNHPTLGVWNANGKLYFPKGRYRITAAIVLHNAYGLSLVGDGAYASAVEMDTTTASMFVTDNYQHVSFTDLAFVNTNGGGNSYASQTTSIGVDLHSSGTGSVARFVRCAWNNWVHCVKNTGTSSGDSGIYEQCTFRKSQNAWYSDNLFASIQRFSQCVYDLITVGGVNTYGIGMIHMDSPNFVGNGSLFFLRTGPGSTWGDASNYQISNGKMEWTAPSSMWVNCQAVDGSETLPTATFTFLNCSMSGGDGGNVTATDPILTLCGAMNVQWVGGNFRGAVRYIKSTQLSTATNLAAGVRTEVSFVGLKWAPHPSISIIVFDPSGGGSGAAGPVFTWRACGNVPDMEIGGEIGQNYRQPHSVKFQPYLKGHMGVSYVASPYPGTVDFAGRTVRIDKILFVVLGTMPAGTKRIEAFSDAARTLSLGYFVTTFTGAAFMELPLDLSPTIIVDKLYLLLTTPVAADVRGYYLIDYTVLD